MTELFTEEDVRRYAEKLAVHRGWPKPNDHGTYAESEREQLESEVHAVLSALAEDGRLRPAAVPASRNPIASPQGTVTDLPAPLALKTDAGSADITRPLAEHEHTAESGGALPSDTPALAEAGPIDTGPPLMCGCGNCISTTSANPGYRSTSRADEVRAFPASRSDESAGQCTVPAASDPVSVLEEETRDDPRTS